MIQIKSPNADLLATASPPEPKPSRLLFPHRHRSFVIEPLLGVTLMLVMPLAVGFPADVVQVSKGSKQSPSGGASDSVDASADASPESVASDNGKTGSDTVSDATVERSRAGRLQVPLRSLRGIVYRKVDGERVKADMVRPDDDRQYPMVLMIHGGAWSSGDKWNLVDHAREMAQAGFVAIAINYRLAPLHMHPEQVEDCRVALRWMSENAAQWNGDPNRIAVWGYSAGANLAALLALHPQATEPRIAAAVLGGPPCEFSFIDEKSPVLSAVMGGTRAEKPDAYRRASPLEFASSDDCPVFIFHGTSDLIVPQKSSQMLREKLSQVGADCQYYAVEGKGHLLTFLDAVARKKAIEFLSTQLQTSPPHMER